MPEVFLRLRISVNALDIGRGDGQPFAFDLPEGVTVSVEDAPGANGQSDRKLVRAQTSLDVTQDAFNVLRSHASAIRERTPNDWSDDDFLRMITPPAEISAVLRPASERLARVADAVDSDESSASSA